VLADSFITAEQARARADWIASTGKNLTTIYATHGHGDHFFGASLVLERFPKARFVATPAAIEAMKEQSAPQYVASFWESRFPNPLPTRLVVAEELSTDVIELEGERLMVIPLGFTDTEGTACLHVPSLELIAAGDAAYNGVHPRLMEANQSHKRDEWISALNKMESLKPRIVIAGHKNVKNDDDGRRVIGQTRQYILDFQELAGKTRTATELYEQMLGRYPPAMWPRCKSRKKSLTSSRRRPKEVPGSQRITTRNSEHVVSAPCFAVESLRSRSSSQSPVPARYRFGLRHPGARQLARCDVGEKRKRGDAELGVVAHLCGRVLGTRLHWRTDTPHLQIAFGSPSRRGGPEL
jgi:glyoxylase-like metal-dependent hydrolase (beta-lactamase superfamily II)